MKILITGANGLLGQHLVKQMLETTTHTVIATGKGGSRLQFPFSDRYQYVSLDMTDGVALDAWVRQQQPQCIIHAAAKTQVDACELNPIDCWYTNVTATGFLLAAAEAVQAYFLYVSTDFVFDGTAGPYTETDTPAPVNYYGSSKLAAEKMVQHSKLMWSIVRTVLVYGDTVFGTRSNIISWVRQNLLQQKPIQVVTDQWRTPTYVDDLARGIVLAVEKKAIGIYHISGKDFLSPYEMALATAAYFQLDATLIHPVTASTFSQPARRPPKTGFVVDKAVQELGFAPLPFVEGIKRMANN